MNRKCAAVKAAILLLCCIFMLTGCLKNAAQTQAGGKIPAIPEKIRMNTDDVPILNVYNTATDQVDEMDIETYLMGVVAGEMKNTWPEEALKAQAILARTFTMKFLSSKDSAYEGADISTDVTEAQAYNASAINDAIRQAVNDTRGLVMVANGDYPYAWFHAHSGGMTELPSKALEYKEDPGYLKPVKSSESDQAPEDVKNWKAEFTLEQVQKACKDTGVETGPIEKIEIGERGESGRAVTLIVNGKEVSAPGFRLNLDASALKSTLIHTSEIVNGKVIFTGSGFGHGVGMSQWGAHSMASAGKSADEIIHHYFSGVDLVEMW